MTIHVGINGFGRIGRCTLSHIAQSGREDIRVIKANATGPLDTAAHLMRYDSVHGRFPGQISVGDGTLDLGQGPIEMYSTYDPSEIDWSGCDVVLECTGKFNDGEKAAVHLDQGAGAVLISAPAKNVQKTIVYGVNDHELTADTTMVSNGSCTTNCLAPLAKVFNDNFGIERGFMMTAHAYTADQNLQDGPHGDLHRARAAALNIVPASTGAAKAIGLVLPELNGKLSGSSYRVPIPTGSIVDLTLITPTEGLTKETINAAYEKAAAEGELAGYLAYNADPIVSTDIVHDPHSSIFDAGLTNVSGNLVKVSSWYDNEWGYSNRLVDLTELVASKL